MRAIAVCWLFIATHATAPSWAAGVQLPGPAFPVYATPAELEATCARSIDQANAAIRQLEARPAGPGWLAGYDDLNALIEDLSGPVYLLSNVHPDKAMRDASEACELRWQDLSSTLGQNEKLYRAALAFRPRDAIDRELRKQTLEAFEDSGVGLPADKRARAKTIADRINELGQQFDKSIRDANVRLAFTDDELQGVPEPVWREAARDGQGRVLLGLDSPSYVPVMSHARQAATRERMWRAKNNEGGETNLRVLAEIGQLRREYARLFGRASFADFTLRRRMAGRTAHAIRFLEEVRTAVVERERRELDELREAKARDLGRPVTEVKLDRWDVTYYTERVKRARYSVDQDAFRPYFPPQQSLQLVMRLAEKLFGVRYERVVGVPLWHPDAQAYAAVDVATGHALATLYVDAYPREGKYNHAAVWPIRSASARLQRTPQAALVVNFDRKGLSLDEMETLLHEFGHALHNNLSTIRHSSSSSVLRDFVEAPSQMLEQWVYDPAVLGLMQDVCPQCQPVSTALLAQAKVAERYGKGGHYARQRLYASFDLSLHDARPVDPMALWARMERETPLGHVSGTLFPAGFSHVAGGYAAGYYGYLWSEVLAADLRTAFAHDRLDARVGRRYRDTVLARGGEQPPGQLVQRFLQRATDSRAFFADLKQ